jgi:hypothetical protein
MCVFNDGKRAEVRRCQTVNRRLATARNEEKQTEHFANMSKHIFDWRARCGDQRLQADEEPTPLSGVSVVQDAF